MDETLDLDTLLQRLRVVAAQHGDAAGAAPVARPWLGAGVAAAGAAASDGVPWALAARAGGLGPFLLADEAGFVALAYRQLLARTPDASDSKTVVAVVFSIEQLFNNN